MVRGIANSKIGFGDLILLLRYFFKLKVSTHPNSFVAEPNFKYGQKFVLQDELTGEPLANVCYEIYMNGEIIHGRSDKEGFTELITSKTEAELEIKIILEEHEHGK